MIIQGPKGKTTRTCSDPPSGVLEFVEFQFSSSRVMCRVDGFTG